MSWIRYLLLMRVLKKYVMGLRILTVEEGDYGIGLIFSRNSDASFSKEFFLPWSRLLAGSQGSYLLLMRVLMKYVRPMCLLSTADENVDEICYGFAIYC